MERSAIRESSPRIARSRISRRFIRATISLLRHCERSEAIHGAARGVMDCFVASLLAMTACNAHRHCEGPGYT
jgi:hypothetical protein